MYSIEYGLEIISKRLHSVFICFTQHPSITGIGIVNSMNMIYTLNMTFRSHF